MLLDILQFNKTFHDPIFHFIATGTSIAQIGQPKEIKKPKMLMRLRGGNWTDVGSYGDFIPSGLGGSFDDDDDLDD